MLTAEEQETLVRVGPGTPMGRVMRRYWHPVALSEQLPAPDCAPLRVRLLGENLVVFRDSDGRPGVIDEWCCHRGVSLALGRVEEGGIRCLYHGWKFAVDGTILETPNHDDPRFRERFKHPAYPVREQSGLIWSYIGTQPEPPFRRWEFDALRPDQRVVLRINVKANYLQLSEGGVDSSHVGLLHSNQVRPEWRTKNSWVDRDLRRVIMVDQAPAIEMEDTPFGFRYAALRAAAEDPGGSRLRFARVVPIMMPTMRTIPSAVYATTVFETPDDDGSTSTYLLMHSTTDEPLDRARYISMLGLDDPRFWSEKDCTYKATWDDNFFQDRAGMKDSWTGFPGIETEDAAMSLSCAPYSDRTKENLVPADQGVIRLRRRLLDCVKLEEAGEPPLGLLIEDMSSITAYTVNIPADGRWQDLVRGAETAR